MEKKGKEKTYPTIRTSLMLFFKLVVCGTEQGDEPGSAWLRRALLLRDRKAREGRKDAKRALQLLPKQAQSRSDMSRDGNHLHAAGAKAKSR
jgi:hypothetical protein